MKIGCDLCDGVLAMSAGGKSAYCLKCGMVHSLERVWEKVKPPVKKEDEIKIIEVEEEEKISREEDFVFIKSEFGLAGGEEEVLVEYTGDAEIIIVPDKTDAFGMAEAEKSVFRYPEKVKKVILSQFVSSIGDYAFCGCTNLEEIQIPECVAYLWYSYTTEDHYVWDPEELGRSHIFQGCTSLKKVVFEPRAWEGEDIADGLFKDCISLNHIELPETIQWIGRRMFEGCTALEEIIIPDSVSVIGQYAFKDCKNLKRVILPDHALAIHPSAFQGTQFRPPMQYVRGFDVKRCSVCGGKLNLWSQCKKCGRHVCYCGNKNDWISAR